MRWTHRFASPRGAGSNWCLNTPQMPADALTRSAAR